MYSLCIRLLLKNDSVHCKFNVCDLLGEQSHFADGIWEMKDANDTFLPFPNVCFDTMNKLVNALPCDEKTNKIENK